MKEDELQKLKALGASPRTLKALELRGLNFSAIMKLIQLLPAFLDWAKKNGVLELILELLGQNGTPDAPSFAKKGK